MADGTDGVLTAEAAPPAAGFQVHLGNFEGPFDLLLGLIAKHQLDVTEVALATVTDEFISYIRELSWDLDQTSEFLVVAATLLDLKAARLLPRGDVEDEEDLALLEARDLLFARLLQYRAYREIAALLESRLRSESERFPRAVTLEPQLAQALPEVVLGIGPEDLARLAAQAMAPRVLPTVGLEHLHQSQVSVREEAVHVVEALRAAGTLSFRVLTDQCASTLHVVARFLALLELYRERLVTFDQADPLGELTLHWSGSAQDEPAALDVGAEFDEETTS